MDTIIIIFTRERSSTLFLFFFTHKFRTRKRSNFHQGEIINLVSVVFTHKFETRKRANPHEGEIIKLLSVIFTHKFTTQKRINFKHEEIIKLVSVGFTNKFEFEEKQPFFTRQRSSYLFPLFLLTNLGLEKEPIS